MFKQYSTFGKIVLLGILTCWILPVNGYSQSNSVMTIPRLDGAIKLDGKLDEVVWDQAKSLPMIMYLPISGNEPTEKSDIRIGYTDEYLYVGARMYDSDPSKIQSTALERDSGSPTDDFFGVIIDTFNDNENALAFFVTPGGARTDATIFNDSQGDMPFNDSWNTFWDVVTEVNQEGWFAEIRIPFSSLRYENSEGEVVMGLIAQRWIARKSESSIFPAIPNEWGWFGQWKPSQSQKVQFTNLENKRPLYIAPYLLGGFGQQHELNEAETNWLRDDQLTYDAGVDIKYGLTSNLTLDLTVNTDFAQVEADNQQVNLTRFSLFFPEKRKFFQERASLFNVSFGGPNRLFYSRRIGITNGEEVRLLGGARLVGRIGGWDLGFINMQTARRGTDIPSENFGVLRLRRRVFNSYSYIGTMVTSRIGEDGSYNYALGGDGIIRLFENNYLTANIARTFENGEEDGITFLDATRIHLGWETRDIDGFGYNFSFSRSGSDYNPELGFEVRENYTRFGNSISYGWFTSSENSPFINHQVLLNGSIFLSNIDGTTESADFGPRWNAFWKSGGQINAGPSLFYENLTESFELFKDVVIPPGSYQFYGFEGIYSTAEASLFTLRTNLEAGQFFDGYRFSNSYNITWSVTPKFKIDPFYELNRVVFPKRDDAFTAHVGRLRLRYYFNNELSISTFVQYSNASESLISNFRLRYNPKEGNDLYIVYNEGMNTDRYSYTPVRPLSATRTILVKYTYTFH
ncbi:MAG: DUF5916 domain-containing protein [Balneolaceae bacterium]